MLCSALELDCFINNYGKLFNGSYFYFLNFQANKRELITCKRIRQESLLKRKFVMDMFQKIILTEISSVVNLSLYLKVFVLIFLFMFNVHQFFSANIPGVRLGMGVMVIPHISLYVICKQMLIKSINCWMLLLSGLQYVKYICE